MRFAFTTDLLYQTLLYQSTCQGSSGLDAPSNLVSANSLSLSPPPFALRHSSHPPSMPRALMIIAAALLATATAAADPSSSPPWAKGLLSRFAAAVNTSGHSDPRLPLVVSVRPGQEALLRFICGPVKAAFSGPRCRDLLKSSCDHAYTSPGLLGWSGSYSQAELRALHNCAPLLMTLVEHDGHVRASASASSVNSSPLSNSAVAASAAGSPPASLPTLGPPMSPPWNLDRVNQARMPLDGSFSAPATAGAGVTVYVVDTGVRSSHSEFLPRGGGRSRASLGADFVRDATTAACPPAAACDCDGHGTHGARCDAMRRAMPRAPLTPAGRSLGRRGRPVHGHSAVCAHRQRARAGLQRERQHFRCAGGTGLHRGQRAAARRRHALPGSAERQLVRLAFSRRHFSL